MDKLRDQAEAVGGTVLSHLGNHEWMNAIGDWRYVHTVYYLVFTLERELLGAVHP